MAETIDPHHLVLPSRESIPKTIDELVPLEHVSRETANQSVALELASMPDRHNPPVGAKYAEEARSRSPAMEEIAPTEPTPMLLPEEAVTWVALPEAALIDVEEVIVGSGDEPVEFIASNDTLVETVVEEEAEALLLEDLPLPEVVMAGEWAAYFTGTELPLFSEPEGFEAPEEVCPVPHDAAPETGQYVTEFEAFIAPYLPESVTVAEEDVLPLAHDLLRAARVHRQAEVGSEEADEAAEVLGQLCGKLFERLGIGYDETVVKQFVRKVIEQAPIVDPTAEVPDIDLLNHYGTHEYKAGDIGSIWQALAQVLYRQVESCKSIGSYVLRSLSIPAANSLLY